MLGYNHILLAIDFSQSSRLIFDRVKSSVSDSQASFTTLHILELNPAIYQVDLNTGSNESIERIMQKRAEVLLTELCEEYKMLDCQKLVRVGSVKHEIKAVVAEYDCDLVVCGTHGHQGLDMLLGSKAYAIIHSVPCDVLAVRVQT